MLRKNSDVRYAAEIISLDMAVPKEHLLRKIDSAMDFTHIYDFVSDLYSKDIGRPSVDPVVLFKIVLIQHLFGIDSLRRTIKEIEVNIAYRWFLGFGLLETIPHFATVSYNFLHRFTPETTQNIFEWILFEAEKSGYLKPEHVFIDSTHIKANANFNKRCKREIPKAARIYDEQLREEINADRIEHGKKPFKDDDDNQPPKTKIATESTVDSESGVFRKGEHKHCFAYSAHTVCDEHNFILDVEVTAGNLHDSTVFDKVYDNVILRYPQVEAIAADAGYKTPWICKKVFDDGRLISLPYRAPMTKKGNLPWQEYVYDEYYDMVICPMYETLTYSTTSKEGIREYKSNPHICLNCPKRELCTQSKNCQKMVGIHIWRDYLDLAEEIRLSPYGKEIYEKRKKTIERVFADAKEKHAMRYTRYKGLKQVTNWVKLKYAAMNLKKLAMWKWNEHPNPSRLCYLLHKLFNEFSFSMLKPVFAWR